MEEEWVGYPMLKLMDNGEIFSIRILDDGFEVFECCELHFSKTLTADQLRALGREIIALADGVVPAALGPA